MVGDFFVSLISSLRAFSTGQITWPINAECCYVHCRAITTSSFFQKRDWSTPTADSSPSDSTFLITGYLSSQQAFKTRLLTQTPTESLGTSAHCEQQDPGVPLICIWCQDEIQVGCASASTSRLQWEENQMAQVCFSQPTDRKAWEIRTWGLARTWPDLYSAHRCCFPGALDAVQHARSSFNVHPWSFRAPTPQGEANQGMDNGDELKAQRGILCLCMTDKNQRKKSTLVYILCSWRALKS